MQKLPSNKKVIASFSDPSDFADNTQLRDKLNEIIDWINKMDAAILRGSGKEDPKIHPPLKISKREKMMKNNPAV